MDKETLTVEIDGDHTFEFEIAEDTDAVAAAQAVYSRDCVVEVREDGALTVHPVSRVTAVYVGTVPSRRIGFPTIPRE